MTMTRLAVWTLGATASLVACVQTEDLSDPLELMSASDTGSESSSGDDGASSVSATSTTGEGGCATTTGTRTSLVIHAGPADNPMLYGISDVVITPGGEVEIAFIQGDHQWAVVHADGTASFDDPPGTLGHVGYFGTTATGRRVVGLDGIMGAVDWLQSVEPDGTVGWNAAPFVGSDFNNNLLDEVVALADGGALAHVFWVDDIGHSKLVHIDASGAEVGAYQVDATGGLVDLVEDAQGQVWGVRQVGNDSLVERYDPGSFAAPAQTQMVAGRWVFRVQIDAQGRALLLSQDAVDNWGTENPKVWLEIMDPADGTIAAAYNNHDTPGFGFPNDVATGPCGEIFVAGRTTEIAGWVAELDEDGVAWADVLETDAVLYAGVAADGTLIAVGQTTAPNPDVFTIGPFVARYEP